MRILKWKKISELIFQIKQTSTRIFSPIEVNLHVSIAASLLQTPETHHSLSCELFQLRLVAKILPLKENSMLSHVLFYKVKVIGLS